MTVQGVSGAGYFDLVAIQKGRSEAVLFVNGVIAPPGAGRIADLARIAAAELSN